MTKLYEIYSGEELRIAELIQRRRLQMLVHSYIYYEMDNNIISDSQWSKWATELRDLQNANPKIAVRVPFRDGFEDWDGSTGAFLPLHQPWIVAKAYKLLGKPLDVSSLEKPEVKPPTKQEQKSARKKLF